MTKHPEENKPSVFISRLFSTFSHSYSLFKSDQYLALAYWAYNYLTTYLIEKKYNGVYWTVDCKGNPVHTKKQIFASAFAICGLVEYYKITNKKEALDSEISLYDTIQNRSFDEKINAYFNILKTGN